MIQIKAVKRGNSTAISAFYQRRAGLFGAVNQGSIFRMPTRDALNEF